MRPELTQGATATPPLEKIYDRIGQPDQQEPLSAICLSGGGIRSATFNLGVLQHLAHLGILQRFDFLSSVSGGGYIASWLQAWMHHDERALDQLQGILAPERVRARAAADPQPAGVQQLPDPEARPVLRRHVDCGRDGRAEHAAQLAGDPAGARRCRGDPVAVPRRSREQRSVRSDGRRVRRSGDADRARRERHGVPGATLFEPACPTIKADSCAVASCPSCSPRRCSASPSSA